MTRPPQSPLPPRTAAELAEDDFVRGILASTQHRALAISDIAGRQFYGFCPQCGWRGAQWLRKAVAQGQADRHNEGENA